MRESLEASDDLILSGRYGQALGQTRRRRVVDADAETLAQAARLYRFAGNARQGVAAAHRLLRHGRREGNRHYVGLAYYLTATNVRVGGNPTAALDLLARAERAFGDDATFERACVLLERAEVLLECGWPGEAARPLMTGCALSHELEDRRLLAWALYLAGLTQSHEDAFPTFLAALELAESFPCPELQWQIHWRIGQRARAVGVTWLERDSYLEAFHLLTELSRTLSPAQRDKFWSVPARRMFLREWEEAPTSAAVPPTDWDYLLRQRFECRMALPAYCRDGNEPFAAAV